MTKLASSQLKSKIEAAVEASELQPEELLEALQGEITPAAADGYNDLVSQLTLEQIGLALHNQMERREDSEWPEFYRNLTKLQQGSIVTHLMHRGFAPASIALSFGCSEREVRKLWEDYSDKLGQLVTGIRLQTIVGQLQARSESLYEAAVRDGKLSLAWKIETQRIELLQDLNVVERAVHRTEVTHKMELSEADEQELEQILDLRRKRAEAQEAVKQIEATTAIEEPLPEDEEGETELPGDLP